MDIFSYLEGLIGNWFTNFFSGFILNELENMGMPSGGAVGTQDLDESDAITGGNDPFTGGSAVNAFTAANGGWIADPFTTVGDADTNAGGVEVEDPFYAPASGDSSQALALNGNQPSQSNQWVTTPAGLQIQIPSQILAPQWPPPSVSDVPVSFGDSQPQVYGEDTGPKLGQAVPTTPAQVVPPGPSAPSTVSTVTLPSASDYDPSIDRGDQPAIYVPPAPPPIDTWPTSPPAPTEFGPPAPGPGVVQVPEITIYGETERQAALDIQARLGVDPYELALQAYGVITMHELEDRLYQAHVFDYLVPTDPSSQHNQVFDEISEINPYGGIGPRNRPVIGTEWQVAQLRASGQQAINQEFARGVLTGAAGFRAGAATSGVGAPFGGAEFDYPALGPELDDALAPDSAPGPELDNGLAPEPAPTTSLPAELEEVNALFGQKVKENAELAWRLTRQGDYSLHRIFLSTRQANAFLKSLNSGGDYRVALLNMGHLIEKMVAADIAADPRTAPFLQYVSGPGRADFFGLGPLEGWFWDVTTFADQAAHESGRWYSPRTFVHGYSD